MHRLTIQDVPEEILERILALVLVQSAEPSPRPSWHQYQTSSSPGHATVISPLLVCRAWLRIATPIHYRRPVLRSARHAALLLRALRHAPSLGPCVRSLHLHATSPALRDIVPFCTSLDTLDITVDNGENPHALTVATTTGAPQPAPGEAPRDRSVIEFCEGFTKTRYIRHLVIRKNAYLTQPNAIYVFEQLAKAVTRWHRLETVNVGFRLSPSPAAAALTTALAAAPSLHTVHTQLPAVWNNTLLDIAQNPALARIVISPPPEQAGAHLFLAEAKRHPRLVELIRAGAPPARPHPASPNAFSLAGSARARASSAVVASRAPPVPTWGYERDVPPPTCPPVRRSVPHPHPHGASVGVPGTVVGPSAYMYAPPPAPTSAHYPHAQQQYQQHGAAYPAPQYAHHHSHANQYAHTQYSASQPQSQAQYYQRMPPPPPSSSAAIPQPPYVGGQPPRRTGPGSRRMTAS